MTTPPTSALKVFYSYAHADQAYRKKLGNHLSNLIYHYHLQTWFDRDILPGDQWETTLDEHLNSADLILLLISDDFMGSKYCYHVEMMRALERDRRGEAKVIPILVRPTYWKNAPFSYLQMLPTDAQPITSSNWPSLDDAYVDVVAGIDKVIKKLLSTRKIAEAELQKQRESGKSAQADTARVTAIGVGMRTARKVLSYDIHSSWVVALAWQPGGNRIASAGGDGTVRVWDADEGRSLLTYRGHTRLLARVGLPPTIYTLAWSPDGLCLASAGDGAQVRVWDAASGYDRTVYQGHSGFSSSVYALSWSPDGTRMASACSFMAGTDKTVHIWDVGTGKTLLRCAASSGIMPNFSVLAVAWSPDGTSIASACDDKKLRVWAAASGRLISTYQTNSAYVSDIAWSPDNTKIATTNNHTIQIWDTKTAENILTYYGHSDSVRDVAWSPDGISIASASNDKTVQIWNSATGRPIFKYSGHTDWTTAVAWSPDGSRIASASNDKTVHIWQANQQAEGS